MPAAQIKIRGLSKWFDGREVFSGIDGEVKQGECLVVTGPNGSGKTTLLRILSGLLRPGRGSVEYSLGKSIIRGEELRRNLSLVAPDLALYDELTALENLDFLSRIQGVKFTRNELQEKLSRFGLGDRVDDLVGSFSSGMKQRLKYVYALLKEPRFLVLDEPTSNLDQEGIKLVDQVVAFQKEAGVTVLATNESSQEKYGKKALRLGV